MSADGQLLVSNDGSATAWRVADAFGDSVPLWSQAGEGAYNTDVSEDGRFVAVSGDVRFVFDARDGTELRLPEMESEVTLALSSNCIGTEFRFSPDARFVAGKRYGTQIDVYDLTTQERVTQIETLGCGQGLIFSADLLTTPEGSFRTSDWSPVAPPRPTGLAATCSTYLEPSSGLVTNCCNLVCQTAVAGILIKGARHPRFWSGQHWLVAAGMLVYVPSGPVPAGPIRILDDVGSEALFAPNGDVIVGEQSGDLVRFCRSE